MASKSYENYTADSSDKVQSTLLRFTWVVGPSQSSLTFPAIVAMLSLFFPKNGYTTYLIIFPTADKDISIAPDEKTLCRNRAEDQANIREGRATTRHKYSLSRLHIAILRYSLLRRSP